MNRELTVSELRERLSSGETVYLLDVREDSEVALGVIEDAKQFAMSRLPEDAEELVSQLAAINSNIVVYCKVGGRSAKVIEMLSALGFSNLENLVGGIDAWNQSL